MAYRDVVLADSPLAYWRMNGDATDASGNGRNGAATGVTWVAGTPIVDSPNNSHGSFNGADYVRLAAAAWMNVSNLTLEAWVRVDSLTGTQSIINRMDGANGDAFTFRLDSGRPVAHLHLGGAYVGFSSWTDLVVGQWYHVAVTYDGARVRMYVDGVLRNDVAESRALSQPANARLHMGENGGGADDLFGDLAEVAFYDRSLTPAEIMEHYRMGLFELLRASGFLARHEAGHADYPFRAASWEAPAGITISVDANGRLSLATGANSGWIGARYRAVPDRGKSFVQALAQGTVGMWSAVTAHQEAAAGGGNTAIRANWSIGRTPDEYTGLNEIVDGTEDANIGAQIVAARALNTEYRFGVFVDALETAAYDHLEALTLSGTAAQTGAPTTGGVGYMLLSDTTRLLSQFFAMADRYVRVSGVPAGRTVEVLDAADAVLASATADSGGVALIDLFTVAFPAPAKIRGGNTVITPTRGVWGGDSYDGASFDFPAIGFPYPGPGTPGDYLPAPTDLAWRARFTYSGGTFDPISPLKLFLPGRREVAGEARYPSGAREAYIVRRFHLLGFTLEFSEREMPAVYNFVETVLDSGESFTFYPDRNNLGVSYTVYLNEPGFADRWFPNQGQQLGLYELDLVLESTGARFDIRHFPPAS